MVYNTACAAQPTQSLSAPCAIQIGGCIIHDVVVYLSTEDEHMERVNHLLHALLVQRVLVAASSQQGVLTCMPCLYGSDLAASQHWPSFVRLE